MTIILSINSSESNSLKKTLSKSITLTGTLRNASSVINPTFTIAATNNLSNYNYCEIPDFGRKYFITNIVVGPNNMWTISTHVDVLSTYEKYIRKQTAVIARQEWLYNLYLNDDRLLVDVDRDIMTLGFSNPLNPANTGKSFVITIAGGSKQSS